MEIQDTYSNKYHRRYFFANYRENFLIALSLLLSEIKIWLIYDMHKFGIKKIASLIDLRCLREWESTVSQSLPHLKKLVNKGLKPAYLDKINLLHKMLQINPK